MKTIFKIIKYLLTIILIIMFAVILVQRVSKNNIALGGYRIFLIVSESMAPDYLIGDILISKSTSATEIELGDRVTYLGKEGGMRGLIVTHTVVDKREEDGTHFFTTQGLANDIADPEITEEDIYGKVVYRTIIFSFFGRLMNHAIAYYGLFMVAGILFSYQIITGFIFNKEDDESDNDTNEQSDLENDLKIIDEIVETESTEVLSNETEDAVKVTNASGTGEEEKDEREESE